MNIQLNDAIKHKQTSDDHGCRVWKLCGCVLQSGITSEDHSCRVWANNRAVAIPVVSITNTFAGVTVMDLHFGISEQAKTTVAGVWA